MVPFSCDLNLIEFQTKIFLNQELIIHTIKYISPDLELDLRLSSWSLMINCKFRNPFVILGISLKAANKYFLWRWMLYCRSWLCEELLFNLQGNNLLFLISLRLHALWKVKPSLVTQKIGQGLLAYPPGLISNANGALASK